MPEPRWSILVHGGPEPDQANALLAAADAGATVLRYGGGAVQAVEAALRSISRGGDRDVEVGWGEVVDGRSLRASGDGVPGLGRGRFGAVALDMDGHLAAGGSGGEHHADDKGGAASILGGGATRPGRLIDGLDGGANPQLLADTAVSDGAASVLALDPLGAFAHAGSVPAALAAAGSPTRLLFDDRRETLDG